jgi:hypothetical protein
MWPIYLRDSTKHCNDMSSRGVDIPCRRRTRPSRHPSLGRQSFDEERQAARLFDLGPNFGALCQVRLYNRCCLLLPGGHPVNLIYVGRANDLLCRQSKVRTLSWVCQVGSRVKWRALRRLCHGGGPGRQRKYCARYSFSNVCGDSIPFFRRIHASCCFKGLNRDGI